MTDVKYSLATLRQPAGPVAAICVDGRYWDLAQVAPEVLGDPACSGLMSVFQDWEANEPRLQRAAGELAAGTAAQAPLPAPGGSDEFLAPLLYPRKVILVGANYWDHMHNDGGHADFSKENNNPVFFLKPPTTTVVGSGRSVRYPRQSSKFDYEIELALIVGKRGRNLTMDNALEYLAGYTVSLDLSARDWQRDPKHLVKWDLFGGKAFDDSFPVGPVIVPAKFLQHDDIRIRLSLNGEPRQDAKSSDMIWSVPEQLVKVSEHVTLEPGDIIATGTPSGVGIAYNSWMKPGDVIDAEAEGIGTLHVEITE
jgi:2-keto-4-pentenoate hydratase/2-oxohepta-3-ene-1,7-dioic acid hydratase in catechol pathway